MKLSLHFPKSLCITHTPHQLGNQDALKILRLCLAAKKLQLIQPSFAKLADTLCIYDTLPAEHSHRDCQGVLHQCKLVQQGSLLVQ